MEQQVRQNNVVAYRRSLGMADSPQAYLNTEHQKRVAKVHELNKVLLENRESCTNGMIGDRQDYETERKSRVAYFVKALNPIEKIQKASAIGTMKLKGIRNPTEFVQMFEEVGSDILFNFNYYEGNSPWQYTYNLPVIKDIHYKGIQNFVDKDFPLANIDRSLLKRGLERMQLLGYKIDLMQEGINRKDSGFMECFNRIAQIPQDQFDRNLQNLNLKGVNLDSRTLGQENYVEGSYKLELNYGEENLIIALETGEVAPELKAKLEAVNEIAELTDGLVRIPFKSLEFYTSDDLRAFSTLIEFELASPSGEYDSPQNFYSIFNKYVQQKSMCDFGRQNIYPVFAEALKETNSYWFVFQTSFSSMHISSSWMYRGFSKGLHVEPELLPARAERLNQLMSGPDSQLLQTILAYHQANNIPHSKNSEDMWFDALQKQVGLVNKVIAKIDELSDDERVRAFARLSLNYFMVFDDELDAEATKLLGSNSGELAVLKQSVAGLLCIRNGEVDPSLIASIPNKGKLPCKMLEEYINSQPDLNEKYIQLMNESQSPEWADTIPDSELFWKENTGWLVAMHSKGLNPQNLQMFRRLNGNVNVREILEDQGISKEMLISLQNQIGLNEQNITYLDKETLIFVKDKIENEATRAKFFRGLLSMHPREFSGAISCLRNTTDAVNIDNSETQKLIHQAINEIGAITPIVLREYVNESDVIRRSKFVEGVKTARVQLLTNQPVRQIFADQINGDELLAELITLSFPGNDLIIVRNELRTLLDRTNDLEGVNANPNGYESKSEAKVKTAFLRDGSAIDKELLDYLKKLIPNPNVILQNKEEFATQFDKALVKLIKGAGSYQLNDLKSELPVMFSVLAREPEVRDVRKAVVDQSRFDTVTQFLGRVSEVVGVYFKDNFSARLDEYLNDYPEVKKHLGELLTDQRLTQIEKNLVKIPEQDLAVLKPAIRRLKENINQQTVFDEKDVATVISTIVGNRVLGGNGGLRSLVKKEIEKFGFKEVEGNTIENEEKPFRGVVSKNAASYFAKRTAGLCTSADIELFNRPDHFHINLIRENTIIGNVQGYMIEYHGKQSFLFRGLNPSSSVVNHGNAEFYSEGMINIIKQFAKDNGMEEVFLSEQLGGWHALTNRVGEGVIDYVAPKYLTKENEVEFSHPITSTQRISKMYRIVIN